MRPVKLVSLQVELERVRKLERCLGGGGSEGDAYFKLKDNYFLWKLIQSQKVTGARSKVSCVNCYLTKTVASFCFVVFVRRDLHWREVEPTLCSRLEPFKKIYLSGWLKIATAFTIIMTTHRTPAGNLVNKSYFLMQSDHAWRNIVKDKYYYSCYNLLADRSALLLYL